jgi:hypothetical protein
MSNLRSSQGFANVGLESLRFKGVTSGGILGVNPQGVASVTTAPTLDSLTVTGDVVLTGAVGMGNLTTTTMTASQTNVTNGTFQNINVQGTALISNLIKINQQETLAVEQLLVGGLTYTPNPGFNLTVQGGGVDISGGNLQIEGNYIAILPTVQTSTITPSDTFSNEIQMGSANLTAVNTITVDTGVVVGAGTDSVTITGDGMTVGGLRINGGLENTITGVETLTVNTINYSTIQTTDPTASIMTSQINAIGTGSTITIELGSQDFPLIVSNASSVLGIYPDVSPTVATQNGLLAANDAWISFPNQGFVIGPSGAGVAGVQIANDGDVTVGGDLSVKTTSGVGVMYVESSAGRVGINDDNPQYTLDVNGTGHFTETVDFDSNINGSNGLQITAGGGITIVADAVPQFPVNVAFTEATQALTLTTTVGSTVHNLIATPYAGGNEYYNGLTREGDAVIAWDEGTGHTPPSYGLVVAPHTGADVGIRIDPSGNVGVGTFNPQYTLDVNGTGNFSDLLTASGGLTVTVGNFNGLLTASGGLTATVGNFNGLLTASGGLTATVGNFTGDVTVYDNLGVGVATPLGKLHVGWSTPNIGPDDWIFTCATDSPPALGQYPSMLGRGIREDPGNSGKLTVMSDGLGEAFGSAFAVSAGGMDICSAMYSSAGPTLADINDISRIFVSNSGPVGIGKRNPTYTLDVSGSVDISDNLIVGTKNPYPSAKVHVGWDYNRVTDWTFTRYNTDTNPYNGFYPSMLGRGLLMNTDDATFNVSSDGVNAYGSGLLVTSDGIEIMSSFVQGAAVDTPVPFSAASCVQISGRIGQTTLNVSGSFNVAGATFHVGGLTSQFYPVLFETEPSWHAGRYTLNIARSPTDDPEYEWPGGPWISTFNFTATGHNTAGGNGADWYKWDYVQNPTAVYDSFLGGYDQVNATTRVVAWLRGDLTYNWSGMGVTPYNLNSTGITVYDAGLTYAPTTNNAGFTSFSNSFEYVSPYNSPLPTIQKGHGNPVTLGVWGDLSVVDTSSQNVTIANINNGTAPAGFTSSCPVGGIQSARISVNDYIGLNTTYAGGSPEFKLLGNTSQSGINEGLVIWNAEGVGHPTILSVTGSRQDPALTFDATNQWLGVYNSNPQYTLDVTGTGNFSQRITLPNLSNYRVYLNYARTFDGYGSPYSLTDTNNPPFTITTPSSGNNWGDFNMLMITVNINLGAGDTGNNSVLQPGIRTTLGGGNIDTPITNSYYAFLSPAGSANYAILNASITLYKGIHYDQNTSLILYFYFVGGRILLNATDTNNYVTVQGLF